VDFPAAYTTNATQIANDLIALMQAFTTKYPIFQTNPFWVFCESYGGKMTSVFGVALQQAIQAGQIKMNFKVRALACACPSGALPCS
jgi:serine carboxypeptidase 1